MNEFEKWWDTLICSNNETIKHISKITWRTALEWALTQKIQSTEEILIDEEAIKKELLSQQSNNQS